MKNIYKILIPFVLLVLLFSSCTRLDEFDPVNTEEENVAYISIGASTARTIQPDFNKELNNMTDFILSGKKKNSEKEIIISRTDSYWDLKNQYFTVEAGEWTFKLTAFSGNIKLSATTKNMVLTENERTNLDFNLSVDTEGSGTGSFTLSVLADSISGIGQAEVRLYNIEETSLRYQKHFDTGGFWYAEYSVPTGEYWLQIYLYSKEGGAPLNIYESAVKIAAGKSSSATIDVSDLGNAHTVSFDLNGGNWVDDFTPPEKFSSSSDIELPDGTNVKLDKYIFTGWYSNGKKIVSLKDIDSDIVLTAGWKYGKVITPEDVALLDLSYEYGTLELKVVGEFAGALLTKLFTEVRNYKYSIILDMSGITSLRKIPDEAFLDCNSLTSIILPEGLEVIGSNAFYNCSNLESITIPPSLSGIEESGFGKNKIRTINFTGSLSQWLGLNGLGISLSSSYSLYIGDEPVTEFVISDNCTSIPAYAFAGCISLESVTIPESVTSIGLDAFYKCLSIRTVKYAGSLEQWCEMSRQSSFGSTSYDLYINNKKLSGELVIPDSVTRIGGYAFSSCNELTSIKISESVTSIGDGAFSNCTGLKKLIIPETVSSIGRYIMHGCSDLEELTIPFLGTTIDATQFTEPIPVSVKKITISGGKIFTESFYNNSWTINENLTSVTLLDGVTSIANYAFTNCTGLKTVIIPDSVTSIGISAFEGCTELTEVTMSKGITSISDKAFYKCKKLSNIKIPDTVTSIGMYAFQDCTALTAITIPESVINISNYAFMGCTKVKTIVIASSDSVIGASAFNNCPFEELTVSAFNLRRLQNYAITSLFSSLKKATITGGEIRIGAFKNCNNLTTVSLLADVTSIDSNTFINCSNLTLVEFEATDNWYSGNTLIEGLDNAETAASILREGTYLVRKTE